MSGPVAWILQEIPRWSERLQAPQHAYGHDLAGAHAFVCDPQLEHWTFAKSVGHDGEYHHVASKARRRLKELGFVDVVEAEPSSELRQRAIQSFRSWSAQVRTADLASVLDAYLEGRSHVQVRLLVPPGTV